LASPNNVIKLSIKQPLASPNHVIFPKTNKATHEDQDPPQLSKGSVRSRDASIASWSSIQTVLFADCAQHAKL